MVPGKGISPSSGQHRPLHHVHRGPIVLDHVHVHRCEIPDRVPQVPGEGKGLQEDLGHDDRAAEVEH